jgi:hypothetical protein
LNRIRKKIVFDFFRHICYSYAYALRKKRDHLDALFLIQVYSVLNSVLRLSKLSLKRLSVAIILEKILRKSLGLEVLTSVVMRNSVFWDITPCCPLKMNRRFGERVASIFRSKNKTNKKPVRSRSQACSLLGLFHPEDGGDISLLYVG